MDPSSTRHQDQQNHPYQSSSHPPHPNHPHHHHHHHHHHHNLCNNHSATPSNVNFPTSSLSGSVNTLASSLPSQLSQFCNSQQYPLLALQQNFSHLFPPNFPNSAQFNNSQNQIPKDIISLRNQRSTGNQFNHNYHNHLHHHEHVHQSGPHHRGTGPNWRKAKSQSIPKTPKPVSTSSNGTPPTLLNLSAKVVAENIPFQSIERRYQHIPEPVQRQIIFWSFPRHEDDIRMYSSLSSDTSSTNPTTSSTNTTSCSTAVSQFDRQLSSNPVNSWLNEIVPSSNYSQSAALKTNPKKLTFNKGLRLYEDGCVQDALQVGFNLSGLIYVKTHQTNQPVNSRVRGNGHGNINVSNNNDTNANQNQLSSDSISNSSDSQTTKAYRVSVTFDRCKITSVSCSCDSQDIFWCEHVVALIIYRIRNPETIDLRVPISETLSSLDRQQLQKLVQYIIAEHHTEVLPTAQRLLDEMRQSFSEINRIDGAPDPTAGACTEDENIWHLDEDQVNEKVQTYLTLVSGNSKDAVKQINALFEKIREMFRAKDSNGSRLLKLISEQFLIHATRNDRSRPLWDQLVSLWVVVVLNPDLPNNEKTIFVDLLNTWCRVTKCPKEDIERRAVVKRKTADISDDEDSDESSPDPTFGTYSSAQNRSNNYPAHMASHRRILHPEHGLPVLRAYNQIPTTCPCQIPRARSKKMRLSHQGNNEVASSSSRSYLPSGSSSNQNVIPRPNIHPDSISDRTALVLEPRSVFQRALDFKDLSWSDPRLQIILNKDSPIDYDSGKNLLLDFAGNPVWTESLCLSAARIETLRSYGYRDQALRLTVATVRRLKFQQEQWQCLTSGPQSDLSLALLDLNLDIEGWIGHPFDPVNVMLDLLLEASTTAPTGVTHACGSLCGSTTSRCACSYNQALVDFTHKLLPDLASISYRHRNEPFPIIPLEGSQRITSPTTNLTSPGSSSTQRWFHVPVPGCCQKDSYLTLAVELALIALGQQRPIPSISTAHDRAVRQEQDLISKLSQIDMSDPVLIEIVKHQTTLILDGGPFQMACCGVPTDSTPLHTFARYLFGTLLTDFPELSFKIGIYALKIPLVTDENNENYGAARTSPRSINYTHLQSEQLSLASQMLCRAKDERQHESYLRKVYRASVKNVRNPSNLHKLAKYCLRDAMSSVCPRGQVQRSMLRTAFDLGLQVLRMTMTPLSSNSKIRKEAILFIVECSTDMSLDAVVQVMRDARDYFSATEALSLVISKDNDPVSNLRLQAYTKLKLKDTPMDDARLNRRSRDLALESAARDPINCALEAIKFCEVDDEALKRALKIVIDSGSNGSMDSSQLIKVADYVYERNMADRAFEIALVAVDGVNVPSNSENPSCRKDIFAACEYALKVGGFSLLIPKLLNNIECATLLSDIYHRYCPGPLLPPSYRSYANDMISTYRANNASYNKGYNDLLNSLSPELYKQRLEDARWWDAMLKRTMKAFVDTTRNRLQNISPRHYGEFIDFLSKAQAIFDRDPEGPKQFKDLIGEIMKSYKTKKKLMERLKIRFDSIHISSKL